MELENVTLKQLQNKEVIPLREQALQYFRDLEKFKRKLRKDGQTHYDVLVAPEYFTAEVALVFSNDEEVSLARKQIYSQLMFFTDNDIVFASQLFYKLTYGKIDFVSFDKEFTLEDDKK
ncbi:hypothetical protein [Lactococcus phage P1048]|uniref:Uncharacterized protein n=1 Tax=Lactococcus phage P1048 TaxID=2662295 RepID=A0A649V2E6_9CAUD|nr:hypothetical protein H1Z36_gp131 [Lactococcus phage P1048]QGJ84997.1 hypothetical protein [Lactococcus phage P1048]